MGHVLFISEEPPTRRDQKASILNGLEGLGGRRVNQTTATIEVLIHHLPGELNGLLLRLP